MILIIECQVVLKGVFFYLVKGFFVNTPLKAREKCQRRGKSDVLGRISRYDNESIICHVYRAVLS